MTIIPEMLEGSDVPCLCIKDVILREIIEDGDSFAVMISCMVKSESGESTLENVASKRSLKILNYLIAVC